MHPEVSSTPSSWLSLLLPILPLPHLMIRVRHTNILTEGAMQEWYGAYGDSAPLRASAVVRRARGIREGGEHLSLPELGPHRVRVSIHLIQHSLASTACFTVSQTGYSAVALQEQPFRNAGSCGWLQCCHGRVRRCDACAGVLARRSLPGPPSTSRGCTPSAATAWAASRRANTSTLAWQAG